MSLLTNGNYFFTTIFALESFIKLASMSPRYFFAVSDHHYGRVRRREAAVAAGATSFFWAKST